MIIAIRIHGLIGVEKSKKEALERLMLRKKYCCILLREKELPKIINVKDLVAFGKMDEKTLRMLLAARARKNSKPLMNVSDDLVKKLIDDKTTLREEGLKPYMNLHPPRGGFKKSTKLSYPRGILGKNDDIIGLIQRML